MPFKVGTTPRRLRGKNIPQKHLDVFIRVFNSVLKKHKDEGRAYRSAYASMVRELRKDGYRQGDDGTWKKVKTEEELPEVVLQTAIVAPDSSFCILAEEDVEGDKRSPLERALEEGLHFRGVALTDNSVAQQQSYMPNYFSTEFNDKCLKQTNAWMEMGYTCTMYNTHGSALGGFFARSTKSPIGRIESFDREGADVVYQGFISPTTEGRDTIRLIFDKIMRPTSVRIYDFIMVPQEVDSEEDDDEDEDTQTIYEMVDGYIGGIDFCDNPGIPGAGLKVVLESVPTWNALNTDIQEESTMITWDEVTLVNLTEFRPEILEKYLAQVMESGVAVGEVTDDERPTQEAFDALTESHTELLSTVEAMSLSLSIHKAAQMGISRTIAERLEEAVSTQEEIVEKLPEIRSAVLNEAVSSFRGAKTGVAKGTARLNDEDDGGGEDSENENEDGNDDPVSLEQQAMLSMVC